ncbi:MAG: DNA translocase FtsK, partial [Ilumatobacteraceae bacterium]
MATWGEPSRRSRRERAGSTRPASGKGSLAKGSAAKGSAAKGSAAKGSPAKGSPAERSADKGGSSAAKQSRGSRATAVETPPQGTARTAGRSGRSTADMPDHDESRAGGSPLRAAVEGREHEFLGIALVLVGVLLGLAVYLDLAGPLGDGVEQVVGWFAGAARYVVPPVLVVGGITVVRRGRSGSPFRLVLGWTVTVFATLGLLHVAGGPRDVFGNIDELDDAGGLLGAAIGAPLVGLLDVVATVVVLSALVLVGAMLIGGGSLRAMAGGAGRGIAAVVSSFRRPAAADAGERADESAVDASSGAARADTGPYDLADDDDFAAEPERAPRRQPQPKPPRPPKVPAAAEPGEQAELDLGPGAKKGKWVLPQMSTLGRSTAQAIDQREVDERGRALVDALSTFGVETRLVGQTVGPTVTRYELEMGTGVKVARITSLNRDIAYAMAATDVRILAPIPGRSAVGVEVPNHTRQLVSLGDIMTAPEARAATHPLDVAIGKDIAGRAVFLNLATTPHLLIAGTTGAGKSSGINSILTSLLMRTTPEQVRLILIDPKQVEMGQYNRLPHLLTQPVTNPKKAANALSWAVKEMETRYDLLYETGFRDITGYNAAFDRGELQPEPGDDVSKAYRRLEYIVVVVDELNDLMMVAKRDVEESITRIAQKARAVGVHLIVATQRPSVNV